MMAPNNTPNRTQCKLSFVNTFTTGAALPINGEFHFSMPVSTTTTAIYNVVHTTNVAMMPIGKSRCGFLASSAEVETESKPINVKKMIDPPVRIPGQPFGENGCQFAGAT